MGYRVAVVGATGAVGREIIKTLAERRFPVSDIAAVASARSTGTEISFGDKTVLKTRNLETFDFRGWDIGLFSPGASVSAIHAPRAGAAGCIVIDNTSQFRMDADVPLVVPEVNPEALDRIGPRRIIANPNCSTIQMVMALKPLHDQFRIRRVVVSTYQSVSGAGKEGMDELFAQTKSSYVNEAKPPEQFTKTIAFNCIPHIDVFMDDGSTKEEWKMAVETQKILDPSIKVIATCVRVPVFIGHALAVHVEFADAVTAGEARAALREAPGVQVLDVREDGGYVTPAECAGEDAVYVSRIRRDPTVEHGIAFWCVADNLRKGAALNAVQIAETMLARGMLVQQAAVTIRVGVGGWTFAPWRGTFFPKGLPAARELEHASRRLTTIEINGTFYRTQTPDSFAKWRGATPDSFVFSVKAPRGATHTNDPDKAAAAITRFLGSGLTELGPKLGPLMWQFPPTRKFDAEALAAFLALLPPTLDGVRLRHVVELRHASFTDPVVADLLRRRNVARAIIESDKHALLGDLTADFVYARLERNDLDEPEGYASAALDAWHARARKWSAGLPVDDLPRLGAADEPMPRDAFLYFISGDKVRAPDAATAMLRRLGLQPG